MRLNQDRIQAILKAEHSYYGSHDIPIRKDTRWHPGTGNFIATQLTPAMDVLDIGCGNGSFLLEHNASLHAGIGIDYDPDNLHLAEEAKHIQGIRNVEFRLLDFPREVAQLQTESFDVVFSLRGPIGDSSSAIQAALHLLRPDGLLFNEEIGELHQHEVTEIFRDKPHLDPAIPVVKQVKEAMQRNGVDVRLEANLFTKWIYSDVYAWLEFQCNIWTWLKLELPQPDDPRIGQFAERNIISTGEIETTHHVVWVAGVKSNKIHI
jgi:SAM-dependent methyltransferase